jgi:D-alanyl-D-alanine carboxypeptidase (penicillin-binding protein 5/6)
MLPSGADATLGLANYIAGSESAFVELMNAKAEEIGLTGTHFANASGLHNKNHYTTAQDVAMMIEYAINSDEIGEEFLNIIGAETYTTSETNENPSGIELTSLFFQRNTGYYIDRDGDGDDDADIIGGKTGFTNESGYSLASVYKINETYYVCVTMKSESDNDAVADNINITEKYLPTYDLLVADLTGDDDSSTADDDSEVVDTTPTPIDQTESEEDLTESSETDSADSADSADSSDSAAE